MGWQIVRHGLTLVLRNPGSALRASLVPVVLHFAVVKWLLPAVAERMALRWAPSGLDEPAAALVIGGIARLVAPLFLATLAWIAVAWHRHVLLGEPPGVLPRFRPGLIGRYVGRSLLVILLTMGTLAGLVLPVFTVVPARPHAGLAFPIQLLLLVARIVLLHVSRRLGLTLPASALRRPIGFEAAWRASRRDDMSVWPAATIALALLAASRGVDQLTSPLGQAISIAVIWLAPLLGVSLLTALDGHLVERRPLTP